VAVLLMDNIRGISLRAYLMAIVRSRAVPLLYWPSQGVKRSDVIGTRKEKIQKIKEEAA
jgi:hypothetical protein